MRSAYRFATAIGVGSPQRQANCLRGPGGEAIRPTPKDERTTNGLAEGKTRKEAIRYLKRRLCDVVDRRLVDDQPNRWGPTFSGTRASFTAASASPLCCTNKHSGPFSRRRTGIEPARALSHPHRF